MADVRGDAGPTLTVDAPVGTPVFVRLSDGAAAQVGQKTMAASVPVVVASDQGTFPVTISAKTASDNLTATTSTAATITLASLASSATVARQATAITLIDGNNNVPQSIDIDFFCALTTGTLANDKTVYLFAARSMDGTNYEAGPPAVGATDAAYTFTSTPVGTGALATDFFLVGAILFNAQSESRRKLFRIVGPPAKLVFVVLNFTGIALTATAGNHGITYRARYGDSR